jgi:hypothetical protein
MTTPDNMPPTVTNPDHHRISSGSPGAEKAMESIGLPCYITRGNH